MKHIGCRYTTQTTEIALKLDELKRLVVNVEIIGEGATSKSQRFAVQFYMEKKGLIIYTYPSTSSNYLSSIETFKTIFADYLSSRIDLKPLLNREFKENIVKTIRNFLKYMP